MVGDRAESKAGYALQPVENQTGRTNDVDISKNVLF
jgi:hypothetical protein